MGVAQHIDKNMEIYKYNLKSNSTRPWMHWLMKEMRHCDVLRFTSVGGRSESEDRQKVSDIESSHT